MSIGFSLMEITGLIAQSQWPPEEPDRHVSLLPEGGCSVMAGGVIFKTSDRRCWLSLTASPYPEC